MVGRSHTAGFSYMRKKIETKHGEATSERALLPFYKLIGDLSYPDLLKVRLVIRERCLTDLSFRAAIVQACSLDCAFFAGIFAVFHETRMTEKAQGAFPVHLDPDQADVLAVYQKYGGLQDITHEKSRGIGVSYLLCVYVLWLWLFHPAGGIECGLLSKDEDALDVRNRPSSLMGKLDLLFANLPAWMRLDEKGKSILNRTTTDHKFENLSNGNAILGFVPTNDKLRSSRLFCLGADESAFLEFETQRWLASAHGTTPSIIYVSTHDGINTMFYRLVQDEESELIRLTTWWHENRRCRQGLYRSVNGRIEILDTDYKFPDDYQFSHKHAPRLRSPWADRVFNRPGADPDRVLQELYGLAVADLKRLFQEPTVAAVKATSIGPAWRGTVLGDGSFAELFEDPPLHAFKPLEVLTGGRYALGCDPSNGVPGGAFAGLSAIDMDTGEQVLSGLFSDCDAVAFAKIAVVISKRLSSDRGRCKIVFESTGGVGAAFANELARLKFPLSATEPMHNSDRGESWLVELARAIDARDVVIRDARLIDELSGFVFGKLGRLEYVGGEGHGDGAIGAALGWQRAKEFSKPKETLSRYTFERHPAEMEKKLVEARRRNRLYSTRFGRFDY